MLFRGGVSRTTLLLAGYSTLQTSLLGFFMPCLALAVNFDNTAMYVPLNYKCFYKKKMGAAKLMEQPPCGKALPEGFLNIYGMNRFVGLSLWTSMFGYTSLNPLMSNGEAIKWMPDADGITEITLDLGASGSLVEVN